MISTVYLIHFTSWCRTLFESYLLLVGNSWESSLGLVDCFVGACRLATKSRARVNLIPSIQDTCMYWPPVGLSGYLSLSLWLCWRVIDPVQPTKSWSMEVIHQGPGKIDEEITTGGHAIKKRQPGPYLKWKELSRRRHFALFFRKSFLQTILLLLLFLFCRVLYLRDNSFTSFSFFSDKKGRK